MLPILSKRLSVYKPLRYNIPNLIIRCKGSTSRKPQFDQNSNSNSTEKQYVHPLALVSVMTIAYGLYWAMQQQKKGGLHYGKMQDDLVKTRTNIKESSSKLIFVIGEPCTGKTTLSKALCQQLDLTYLSIFNLLDDELKKPYTPHKSIILRSLKEGVPVPLNTTIAILRQAIDENPDRSFVIDGFFRRMEHLLKFKDNLGQPDLVIRLTATPKDIETRFFENYPYLTQTDLEARLTQFQQSSYNNLVSYLEKQNKLLVIDNDTNLDSMVKIVKGKIWELKSKDELNKLN